MMIVTKFIKLTSRGMLLLAILGSYSATAFTPLSSSCQSTRVVTPLQHPAIILPTTTSSQCSVNPIRKHTTGLQLFRKQADGNTNTNTNNPLIRLRKFFQLRAWYTALTRVNAKLRRATMILAASAMIWFGTAGSYTPPASAASSSSLVQKILPASNEQIIDRYVQRHMFDDDDATHKDPLESAYREAYEDYKTTGSYPRALKEITTEVLGQGAGNKLIRSEDETTMGFFGVVRGIMRFLERRGGMSEATALAVVMGTLVIVTPTSMLLIGTVLTGISKRNMNKLMKKRYGETYT